MYRLPLLILLGAVSNLSSAQPAVSVSPNPFDGSTDTTLVIRVLGTDPVALDSLRLASSLDEGGPLSGTGWVLRYRAYIGGGQQRGEFVCDPFPRWPCYEGAAELLGRSLAPTDSVVFDTFLLYCALCRDGGLYATVGANDTLLVYAAGSGEPQEVVLRDTGVALSLDGGPARPEGRLSVYPNPTKGGASIRIDTPSQGEAEIRVLDTTGRLVSTIDRQVLEAGVSSVPLLLDGLAAGLYNVEVRLTSPSGDATQRYGTVVVLDL